MKSVVEQSVRGVPRLVIRKRPDTASRERGQHARARVRRVVETLPDLEIGWWSPGGTS